MTNQTLQGEMTQIEMAECHREQIYISFCSSLQWRPVGLANYRITQCELSRQPNITHPVQMYKYQYW